MILRAETPQTVTMHVAARRPTNCGLLPPNANDAPIAAKQTNVLHAANGGAGPLAASRMREADGFPAVGEVASDQGETVRPVRANTTARL